jgi:hypothetical protein
MPLSAAVLAHPEMFTDRAIRARTLFLGLSESDQALIIEMMEALQKSAATPSGQKPSLRRSDRRSADRFVVHPATVLPFLALLL